MPLEIINDLDNKPAGSAPVIVNMADVQPEAIQWLWPGRFAIGKLHLIAGDGGLGKSTMALDIAARVSTGVAWPDGSGHAPAGSVLLLSAEDDPADTIRPRLDAACADVSKINVLTGVAVTDDEGRKRTYHVTLHDLHNIEAALSSMLDCRLLIIDPMAAYLGKTDSHVDAEVRGLLGPLAAMAAEKRIAVVLVVHLNKGNQRAIYRISGSQGTYNAVRVAWYVAADEHDEDKRLMIPGKNNLAKPPGGLAYLLRGADNGVACVHWVEGRVDVDLDVALAGQREDAGRVTREDAQSFLLAELADGPVKVENIKTRARKAGIGWRTIEKAKSDLGVESKRIVDDDGAAWWWELPGAGLKTTDTPLTTQVRPCGLAGKPPVEPSSGKTARPHAAVLGAGADFTDDELAEMADRHAER